MHTLIIARHGNTFNKGETPTRVGARTDLPLVESGKEQARLLGKYLKMKNLIPDEVYSAPLKRTIGTAKGALAELEMAEELIKPLDIFTEIDYGPDENKTEDEVVARIGKQAIADWNSSAKVPNGWQVDPNTIINNWEGFANNLLEGKERTTLVITSNGIARFAPYITGNFEAFTKAYDIKLGTGSVSLFRHNGETWICEGWNIKPKDFVS